MLAAPSLTNSRMLLAHESFRRMQAHAATNRSTVEAATSPTREAASASVPHGTLIPCISGESKNKLEFESLAKNVGYPGVAWKLMPSSSHILNLCMQTRRVHISVSGCGETRCTAGESMLCEACRRVSPSEWRPADWKTRLFQCATEP